MPQNLDFHVVQGFGDEWSRFDQSELSAEELQEMFDNYFNIFPWEGLDEKSVGFDLGCGSGRWAKMAAPRVGKLHLVDASADALAVARRNMDGIGNCEFHHASVDAIPSVVDNCDFGYSLGVLHHIPDTEKGLRECVARLKPGAPFLLYLYYALDNKPWAFRTIWKASDVIRRGVSKMPNSLRYGTSQILAGLLYYPLARTSLLLEKMGMKVDNIPLSQYRHNSFYVMRNDALDRFGTRLERRFTKKEMQALMEKCGLENITFSETSFWTAVGYKK